MRRQPEHLLAAVAQILREHGRPRKNPGGQRPFAVMSDGSVRQQITKRHMPDIHRLSLLGAFRYAQIAGRYSKPTVETAKTALYQAHHPERNGRPLQIDLEIDKIDQDTYDSRQIQRNLAAAAKKLRKERE